MSDLNSKRQIKSLSLVSVFKKLWPYIKQHKSWFGLCVALAVVYSLAGRTLPLLFGYAVDEGIKKNNLDLIYQLAIIYLVVELVHLTVSYFKDFTMAKLGNKLMYDIRLKVTEYVQSFPLKYFDKNPIGKTVTRVTNDVMSLGQLFNEGFVSIFVNGLEVLSIIGALLFLSPLLTLYVILPLPLLVWLVLIVSKMLRTNFKESKRVLSTINAFNSESLNGMKTIQLFNRSKEKRQTFAKYSAEYLHYNAKTVMNFATLWPLIGFFRIASLCTVILVGGMNLEKWGLTIGQLSAILLLVQSFFPPFRTILERYNQFQDSLASCDRIFDLFEEPIEKTGTQIIPGNKIKGQITFKDLNFKYESNKPLVLNKINLKINPGESVALIGRTGSGKTTIISLLQKLYTYSDGHILIDELELNDIENSQLRSRLGVVQQDSFIFKGTIRDNITLKTDIPEEDIQQAIKLAQCENLISKRSEGLNAPVEERGANLSAGEKQLICFARALAFNPDILILDEATANIDSDSEDKIQKAIKEIIKGRTSVIIAHRLSTITHCDRIFVLDNGQIIESGSYQELMDKKGAFYSYNFKSTEKTAHPTETQPI